MKKKTLLIFVSALLVCSAVCCGCSKEGEVEPTSAPTEKPTITATQAPTKAPTKAPTEAPTEELTEEPTEIVYNNTESGTFSVIISETITEAPPTEPSTEEAPTQSTDVSNEEILGSWTLTYYEQSSGQHTNPTRNITYTFNSDGTFKVNSNGNLMSGKYTFDGTTISYIADASAESGSFTYDSSADEIRDVDIASGMTAVFTKD